MRIVHLADLHLGFRQFQRQTQMGTNQREADIAQAFTRAIDAVIALKPDLVLIAGDIFHSVRPTNPAILHAFIQLSKLVGTLTAVRVVMVAGNHDLPKTTDAGCILNLFGRLDRIDVATFRAERFNYDHLGVSVLAVPYMLSRPALEPDPDFQRNILLIHGQVEDVIPRWVAEADRAVIAIKPEELQAKRFDYVGLGHYHVYHRVAPNAWYAGSTEYASTNPWGELYEEKDTKVPGKGFIEHDLDTGAHRFHRLDAARAR